MEATIIDKKTMLKTWADAIRAANNAALAAHKGSGLEHDGGTCNFDHPVIDFTGWKQKNIDTLASMCATSIGDKMTSAYWKGCRSIDVPLYGQANNRSRMAEAATKALKDAGLPAFTFYMMD